MPQRCAVFFQSEPPPVRSGSKKPFKAGGYRDSGADMGFALQSQGVQMVTPVVPPAADRDADWVYPDTLAGMEAAYQAGARIFWLNTVLYAEHPILKFDKDIQIVGHDPRMVERFDDKNLCNRFLRDAGLPMAGSRRYEMADDFSDVTFPIVMKPILGRGSQGVKVLHSQAELQKEIAAWKESDLYGEAFLLEEYLSGEEITVSVLPPGRYRTQGAEVVKESHWALPAIERFDQRDGVMPYNGVVPVIENSRVYQPKNPEALSRALQACERAAGLIDAKALIRIDCRQNALGTFKLFDVNMKPNLTGAGRPGREKQDALSTMAARSIGWSYSEFLVQLLHQSWKMNL